MLTSLWKKQLALFLGVFVLSIGGITYFAYHSSSEAMEKEFHIRGGELAKAIATFNFPGVEPPLVVTKLDQYSLAYRHGGLPAFRVESQNDSSTCYFVSSVDGRIFRSTLFTRMRSAVISLHNFSTLELITDSDRVRKLLLLAVSGIALVGTLIGYYMALPHGRRG